MTPQELREWLEEHVHNRKAQESTVIYVPIFDEQKQLKELEADPEFLKSLFEMFGKKEETPNE